MGQIIQQLQFPVKDQLFILHAMATITKVANCPFAISMFGIIWPLHRFRSRFAHFRLTSGLASGPWKSYWTYWKTKETESVYKFCVTMVEMRDQYLLGEDSNQFIGDVIANTFSCTNNKPITSGIFSKSEVTSGRRSFLTDSAHLRSKVTDLWPVLIIQKATRKFGYRIILKNLANRQMLFTGISN